MSDSDETDFDRDDPMEGLPEKTPCTQIKRKRGEVRAQVMRGSLWQGVYPPQGWGRSCCHGLLQSIAGPEGAGSTIGHEGGPLDGL